MCASSYTEIETEIERETSAGTSDVFMSEEESQMLDTSETQIQ